MTENEKNNFAALWDDLKTSVDAHGYKQSLFDPKVQQKSNTIYVEEKDPFAFDFYKSDAEANGNKIQVKTIPNIPNESTVNEHKNEPGLVAAVLINDEKGVRATPYVFLGGNYTELDVSASYFTVLGLLKSGRVTEAKQIAGNITYMIGHTHSLKATNRIYHQHLRALPLYTAMVREIATAIPQEDRSAYLKSHTARAVLDYCRSWHELDSQVVDGLNIYPKTNVDHSTLTFSIPSEDVLSVRLNMMLYKTEKDIAYFLKNYTEGGSIEVDDENHAETLWEEKAANRLKNMKAKLWNPDTKMFNDFNIKTGKFVNLENADFIYALWAEALEGDAAIKDTEALIKKHQTPFGFKYNLNHVTIQAPEQMIAWLGLKQYGFDALADSLKADWQKTVLKNYEVNQELSLTYSTEKGSGVSLPNGKIYAWTLASLFL